MKRKKEIALNIDDMTHEKIYLTQIEFCSLRSPKATHFMKKMPFQ